MRPQVISTHLGFWVEPAAAFEALHARTEPVFWLDSGFGARSGVSCFGTGSRVVVAADAKRLVEHPSGALHDGSIFDFLRREQAASRIGPGPGVTFPLGWVGWLGYEAVRARGTGQSSPDPGSTDLSSTDLSSTDLSSTDLGSADVSRTDQGDPPQGSAGGPDGVQPRYPDAAFLLAERAVVFDHSSRTVTLIALGQRWHGRLALWREETTRVLATLPGQPKLQAAWPREPGQPRPRPVWAHSDREYLDLIRQCQERIRAGDAYQLCLTTGISADVHPDPVATYLRLRQLSPSHHGGFVRIGGISLLSSSPEQFLSVTSDGRLESKPIKGTRPRGTTAQEDKDLKRALLASDKERAENIMIVDLVRNDLSRVCAAGSVAVPHLLQVESYAHVHQLVSTVRGRLAAGSDPVDAVLAAFPAGSMTGAPKASAMQILHRLEQRPRGIYSGAFGYFGLDGSIDLAMVIRSIVLDASGATIGTGGGITALSVPAEELAEIRIKAAALLHALGLVTL